MNHKVTRGIRGGGGGGGWGVPCGTSVGDTWHIGGPSVMPSNIA